MAVYKHFDVLVHPGFHFNEGPRRLAHPKGARLNELWYERARAIKDRPDAALVYRSWLSKSELEGRISGYNPIYLEQERARINDFREMLGERFILWNEPKHREQFKGLSTVLTEHSAFYRRTETTFDVYGEYHDVCAWGTRESIIQGLGIPREHIRLVRELSLSQSEDLEGHFNYFSERAYQA